MIVRRANVMLAESQRHLARLFARRRGLIEIRSHAGGRWHQEFIDAARADWAAVVAVRLSSRADVYVGVLPRRRRGGGRADLAAHADVVWADLDDRYGIERVEGFAPAPSLVVASGTAGHVHACWTLPGSRLVLGCRLSVTLPVVAARRRRALGWRCAPPPYETRSERDGPAGTTYWCLERPIVVAEIERLNRAVARRLGADENSCDVARVLRVAGTS
jgi:hypothetical protein